MAITRGKKVLGEKVLKGNLEKVRDTGEREVETKDQAVSLPHNM